MRFKLEESDHNVEMDCLKTICHESCRHWSHRMINFLKSSGMEYGCNTNNMRPTNHPREIGLALAAKLGQLLS